MFKNRVRLMVSNLKKAEPGISLVGITERLLREDNIKISKTTVHRMLNGDRNGKYKGKGMVLVYLSPKQKSQLDMTGSVRKNVDSTTFLITTKRKHSVSKDAAYWRRRARYLEKQLRSK